MGQRSEKILKEKKKKNCEKENTVKMRRLEILYGNLLQALYQTPDIHKEDISSFTRRAVSHAFIDAIFYTAVMQKAWLFLGQAGKWLTPTEW